MALPFLPYEGREEAELSSSSTRGPSFYLALCLYKVSTTIQALIEFGC